MKRNEVWKLIVAILVGWCVMHVLLDVAKTIARRLTS